MNQTLTWANLSRKTLSFIYFYFLRNNANEDEMISTVSPVACLTQQKKDFDQIIRNICLTPSDTYALYKHIKDIYSSSELPFVNLPLYEKFSAKQFISRNDVKHFEEFLKSELNKESLDSETTHDIHKKLVEKISPITNIAPDRFDLKNDLPKLVEHLKEKQLLPALVFCFDRDKCASAVRTLLDYYEETEERLRNTKYKAKIEQLTLKRDEENQQKKKLRDKVLKKDNRSDEEILETNIETTDYSFLDNYLPECVLGESVYFSEDELNDRLKAFGKDPKNWERKAIERGFFYHHAGLDSKKRVCVESLFRTKKIQLVFCTSTLAQGIHVPCKTAIFLNDSPFLDTGTFKQCAGRAGRRGFDNHANILFLNIPEFRIKHLISSACPQTRGNFLLSPTFVLKLLHLNSSSTNNDPTHTNSLNLLKHGLSQYSSGDEAEKEQKEKTCKFYFLFCCEFLHISNLIKSTGVGCGLMNLVTKLGYHEPGNLVLNHLMNSGLFETLCQQEKDPVVLIDKIITILSYLFNQQPIYNLKDAYDQRRLHSSNSQVLFCCYMVSAGRLIRIVFILN